MRENGIDASTRRKLAAVVALVIFFVTAAFLVSYSIQLRIEPRSIAGCVALVIIFATAAFFFNHAVRLRNKPRSVADYVKKYHDRGYDYRVNIRDHTPFGIYLNFDKMLDYPSGGQFKFDADGIPLVKYPCGDTHEYFANPVTIAEFALSEHAKHVRTESEKPLRRFLLAADRLLAMQDDSGALRYPFRWHYYLTGEDFEPGWVSGMSQGGALSVYARANAVTGDTRYLRAGATALDFMALPISEGGTLATLGELDPVLSNMIIFEEYIVIPPSYTLNGFMYALLGLYDWSQVDADDKSSQMAGELFRKGIATLEQILDRYDLGGFTAYDLGHLIYPDKPPHVGIRYHAVHIYLLHALHSVTGNNKLLDTKHKWARYVDR